MPRYRGPLGVVEAAQYKAYDDDHILCFGGFADGEGPEWLVAALNAKTIELSAIGRGLMVNFRGGSYGLARGDWVLRTAAGDIVPCCLERFRDQYREVADG